MRPGIWHLTFDSLTQEKLVIAMGGGERAGLSESMAHRAGNTSPGQGEARRGGKKTKVKRDARKVMLSGCQSVRLAAATWWGGMLSTKRKLILEREKKRWIAGRTDASRKSCFRTVRGTGGGEREKKRRRPENEGQARHVTRGRMRRSSVYCGRAADRGPQPEPGA